MYQLFAGLFTEGTTDIHFLESIVKKTLDEVAFECKNQIETELSIISISKSGKTFVEQVLEASRKGIEEAGIMLLCVHTDADESEITRALHSKIIPAQTALATQNAAEYCQILVAIIPVQMTEAWMLADKDLIKKQLNTTKTDIELGIHQKPESIADPKQALKKAIQKANKNVTQKRRKDLTINDLYSLVGQSLDLEKLALLPSYLHFKENLTQGFRQLNLS